MVWTKNKINIYMHVSVFGGTSEMLTIVLVTKELGYSVSLVKFHHNFSLN